MAAIIRVEKLTKKFRAVTAVDDISFTVEGGEVFGFLGPNGAGKTTTINILCTLRRPTSGRAWVNGFDVTREQPRVRQSIGLVFQDPSLDDLLTAWENLRFHAAIYHVPWPLARERGEELLKLVELWERRRHEVRTFSGGMKRRLELVRGLIHYPRVLFLDEPTLGLDPQTRARMWEFLLDLRRREGITLFLTTHYMDEANYADRIAIIDQGHIVALDTPQALKDMVGGDIVALKTADDEAAAEEIGRRYQVEVRRDGDGLTFEVAHGEEFIPVLARDLNPRILSLSLRRPTLDDVFLKLTGRQIREEAGGGMGRAYALWHRRGMGR